MQLYYLSYCTPYSEPFESSPRPFFLSLQDFVLPCSTDFPNYIFPTTTVYAILVLFLLLILLFHSPAFCFANGTMM